MKVSSSTHSFILFVVFISCAYSFALSVDPKDDLAHPRLGDRGLEAPDQAPTYPTRRRKPCKFTPTSRAAAVVATGGSSGNYFSNFSAVANQLSYVRTAINAPNSGAVDLPAQHTAPAAGSDAQDIGGLTHNEAQTAANNGKPAAEEIQNYDTSADEGSNSVAAASKEAALVCASPSTVTVTQRMTVTVTHSGPATGLARAGEAVKSNIPGESSQASASGLSNEETPANEPQDSGSGGLNGVASASAVDDVAHTVAPGPPNQAAAITTSRKRKGSKCKPTKSPAASVAMTSPPAVSTPMPKPPGARLPPVSPLEEESPMASLLPESPLLEQTSSAEPSLENQQPPNTIVAVPSVGVLPPTAAGPYKNGTTTRPANLAAESQITPLPGYGATFAISAATIVAATN